VFSVNEMKNMMKMDFITQKSLFLDRNDWPMTKKNKKDRDLRKTNFSMPLPLK